MAIYHFSLKRITKNKGQSACQHAAYIAGEKIKSEVLGQTFNYTKPEVVYSNVLLCKNAPEEFKDREKLWNSVEKKEKAVNARLARSIIIALPVELTLAEQTELVEKYIQKNFVDKGMCADFSIHDKNDGNPHAHIMLTLREIDAQGQWMVKQKNTFKLDEDGNRIPILDKKTNKQRLDKNNRKQWAKENTDVNNWSDKETLTEWRAEWAKEQNAYLPFSKHVDHRTLEEQGIDREPTQHVGYRKGVKNVDKLAKNAEIGQANQVKQDIREINKDIEETRKEKINQRVQVTTLKIAIETGLGAEENDDSGINSRTGRRKRLFPEPGETIDSREGEEQEFNIEEHLANIAADTNYVEQQRIADANREIEEREAADAAKRKREKRIRQAERFAPDPARQAEKDDIEY